MVEKAGMKELDLGPTGRLVARNVRWARESLGLSYAALSSSLEALGHRIPVLGLRRIEANARRVDADDLMALAVALESSPIDLMFRTVVETDQSSQGTGLPVDVNIEEARAWARGETPLSLESRERYWTLRIDRLQREAARSRERVARIEAEAASNPNDVSLNNVASMAEAAVRTADQDIKEAVSRREILQMMLESR